MPVPNQKTYNDLNREMLGRLSSKVHKILCIDEVNKTIDTTTHTGLEKLITCARRLNANTGGPSVL